MSEPMVLAVVGITLVAAVIIGDLLDGAGRRRSRGDHMRDRRSDGPRAGGGMNTGLAVLVAVLTASGLGPWPPPRSAFRSRRST